MPKQESLDPVLEKLLKDLESRKRPGHPFNPMIDKLAAEVAQNPELFSRARTYATYMESLLLVAEQLKSMVAEKLGKPELNDASYLTVELEDDWRINAEVEQDPPYHIYVSTNLYRFCARLSQLFIGGLGLAVTDGETNRDKVTVPPHWSKTGVVQAVKTVLDRFREDRTIPAEDAKLALQHTALHDITFYSIMASIVGHEFGHVVMNEERSRGGTETVKAYAGFADRMLRSSAQQLLYTPMHDPDDLAGFSKLSRRELEQVASNWINEITADLIGVDLARKYHRDFGPARTNPEALAFAQMGIHLGFISQLFLYVYLNRCDPTFGLISTTYPPMDFRLHCVVQWMYDDPQHPSVRRIIDYCQGIMNEVLE